jgi:uncharacterized membrane protein YkoI
MNTARLRSKRVLLSAAATVAAVAVGGVVWSATASPDLRGSERDRVAAAATAEVGGTAVDVEAGDPGEEAYEVEVRLDDGTEVDVYLDEELAVIGQDTDDDDRSGTDGRDGDDRLLGTAERQAAEDAALAAVDGETVLEVEASDDGDEAYEVSVLDADGTEWDVDLDADFGVLRTSVDR